MCSVVKALRTTKCLTPATLAASAVLMVSSARFSDPATTMYKEVTPVNAVVKLSLSPCVAFTTFTPAMAFTLSAFSGSLIPARISTLSAYLEERA